MCPALFITSWFLPDLTHHKDEWAQQQSIIKLKQCISSRARGQSELHKQVAYPAMLSSIVALMPPPEILADGGAKGYGWVLDELPWYISVSCHSSVPLRDDPEEYWGEILPKIRTLGSTSNHLLGEEREVAKIKIYTDLKAVVHGLIDQGLKRRKIERLGTRKYWKEACRSRIWKLFL